MSILTKKEIIKLLESGRIKIEPLILDNIGAASVDLTLSDEFRVFEKSDEVFEVSEEFDYEKISKLVKSDSIIVNPKEMVLGITREKITLPENIAGWIEGRSRYARLGLTAHITAPFSNPSIDNRVVLEIYNMGSRPVKLCSGLRLCQFIFEEAVGSIECPKDFKDL